MSSGFLFPHLVVVLAVLAINVAVIAGIAYAVVKLVQRRNWV